MVNSGKTEDFQARMNERIGFVFNFVGVLIGFLVLSLTAVHFCEYMDDAIYLKRLYFLALFFLVMCLFFGFCVISGPIFENSINFMGYRKPHYDKRVKKCLDFAYRSFGLGLVAVISIVVFIVFGSLSWVIKFDVSISVLFVLLFYIFITRKIK